MEVSLDTCGWRMVKSLLLLYVFVVRAAADCPKPQGKENIVLTNEALLKNDFPEGSEATLECANGYIREDGSGTVTCTGGQWTEPDLKCKKKDCGLPRQLPHMSFEFTDKGTLFGATVRVLCDKGYSISGTSYKQCFATGWSGRAKCEVVTCAKPDEVPNGRHSWDSQTDPVYSDVIQYSCHEGYILTGNNSIECSENGEYNSLPPECKGGKDILTTEDTITTTRVTSTAPPPVLGGKKILTTADSFLLTEASTTTAVSPTTHTDKMITTSATSTASTPIRGKRVDVDTNKDTGYAPVIASVISTATVALIVLFILHCFLLKKKGSYDTREDLKPELLQFQNL